MTEPGSAASTRRLLALRAPFHASLSPDGARLLLTTSHVPLGSHDEVLAVSLLMVDDGSEHPVPALADGDHSPVWAPDGTAIAWATTADGDDAIAIAPSLDGPTTVLDRGVRAAGPSVWSPDSRFVAFPAFRGTGLDRTAPFRWTRPILEFDGLGALDDPPQLRVVDTETGEGRWLTDDDWRWGTPRWSPSGNLLATTVSIDPSGRTSGSALRVVHLDGTITAPAVPAGRGVVPAWLPDGRLVVLVAEPRSGALGGPAALFVVELPGSGGTGSGGIGSDGIGSDGTGSGGTGDVRRIDLPNLYGDVYADNPAILPEVHDGLLLVDEQGHLIIRTGARGRMGVVRVYLDGLGHEHDDPDHVEVIDRVEVIADGDRCCTTVALAAGRLVLTSQTSTAPAELTVVEPSGAERALTNFGGGLSSNVASRQFTVDGPDGWPIDAWFLAPAHATGPLPTIVLLHGGPHFAYGEGFNLDAHALVEAGFGVLYPNMRGSTGYGDGFAQAVHGDWNEGPTRDVFVAIDHAVALGWVDGDRLGVAGNSYGGYLAAWLVSTTQRFCAAVIENPVTDLVAMYGTSDIGASYFPPQIGGRPHEALQHYLDQSPLLQAHRCTTPCLFVVGDSDRRCPPAQAWSMHRVLLDAGTTSEMLVLPRSSHEGSTYGPVAGRIAHDDALVEWMTRWL